MNIGLFLVIVVGRLVGVLSTVYCAVSLVAVIGYKIYRSIKYHISIYD